MFALLKARPLLILVIAQAISGLIMMTSRGAIQVSAQSQPVSVATPAVMPPHLTPYALPAHPDQADQGGQVYYLICMVCHGDQGQGLTQQWIEESVGMGPLSCYAADCHGPHHPPDGFVLPKNIPAVRTPAIRNTFKTAWALYEFIRTNMPYQAPGSLTDDQYWQVTAFIMRINGVDLGSLNLNANNAKTISFSTPPSPAGPILPAWALWSDGGLILIAVLLLILRKKKAPIH